MILKFEVDSEQLHNLHVALKQEINHYGYHSMATHVVKKDKPFAFIKSSNANGDGKSAVPKYNVTVEIKEHYSNVKDTDEGQQTSLSVITNIFGAISLFPKEDN